ncbi:TetR family transcriptional regulator [Streptomyces sp. MS19]|uniref:TetR family transcriptional regulator n=1 Tax=Streptomyces sp. MS19 TaxID=3385972 RepID=UPI0039A14EEE
MARWEPGTAERLQEAALELFAARGFEQTTVTDIARAVGLTERTFFRHFSDKREALFHGQRLLADAFLSGVAAAPDGAAPVELVTRALRSAAAFFPEERRPHSRTRQSVIDRNPALQERELLKLAGLAATLADALRARGIGDLPASLAAQSGITVFGLAFTQWIADDEHRPFTEIAESVLHELRALTAAPAPPE